MKIFSVAGIGGITMLLAASLNGATIISENMGSPAATTAIASHTFQNSPGLTYSGTGDCRTTNASSGYTTASASGNVMLNAIGETLLISGVNTTGYTGITLSFGIRKATSADNGTAVAVEYSTDGSNWSTATWSALPTGTGTAIWHYRTSSTSLPAASNLRIRFTTSNAVEYRLDDLLIEGTAAPSDTTPPTVSSVNRQSAENPTNNASITWRVVFSENINSATVGTSDFTLTPTVGALGGAAVTGVSAVNATTFDVTASTGTGDKTLRLDVLPAASINDTAGNDYAATFNTGQTFAVDKTAPAAPSTPDLDSGSDLGVSNSDGITSDNNPTLSGTAEAGSTVELFSSIAGSLGTTTATGGNWSITPGSALAAGAHSFTATATDALGNVGTASSALLVTIDTTAPTVSSQIPAASATLPALSSVEVTFDSSVSSVSAGDLTVNSSAATSISGSSPTFTFSGFTAPGDGVVSVALASGTIIDVAGNSFAGSSWSYTVNNAAPTVGLTASVADSAWTNAPVNYTATFSEGVSGLLDTEISATNGVVSALAGGPSVYTFTVTASGNGDVIVSIPSGVAEATAAPAGRLNTASTDYTIKHDATAPTSDAVPLVDATVVGTVVSINFATTDTLSGVASTALFVKTPSAGSFADSGLSPGGTTFTYTAAESGLFEFYTIGTDIAGNVEAAPVSADAAVSVNTVENGAYTASVAAGSGVAVTFPMESALDVVVTFANVTTSGTLTAQRFETDAAPAGVLVTQLVDQWLAFTVGSGLAFDSATVTITYDEALLGGLTEADIVAAFRDNGGVVTQITPIIVNTTNNTIQFTTPGFSDFYFGDNDTAVGEWMILGEE